MQIASALLSEPDLGVEQTSLIVFGGIYRSAFSCKGIGT